MDEGFDWEDGIEWKTFFAQTKANLASLRPTFDPTGGLIATDAQAVNGVEPDGKVANGVDPKNFITKTYGTKSDISELISRREFLDEREQINPLLVELHLQQAAELLDRVQKTRERISSLRIAKFQSILDLWEFEELDAIHTKEIDAGRYKKPVVEKEGQVKALRTQAEALAAERAPLRDFLNDYAPLGHYEKRVEMARRMAALMHYPRNDVSDMDVNHPGKHNYFWKNFERIHEAEVRQRVDSLTAQTGSLFLSERAATERADAEDQMAKYMNVASSFQIDRIKVERSLYKRKFLEVHTKGGALKYDEQIDPLLISAERDALHALAKLAAVSEGMVALFQYKDAFPSDPSSNRKFDLDECIQWTRDAVVWLRNVGAWDHSLTFTLPFREALNDAWEEGMRNGALQIDFAKLPSTKALLKDWRQLRLRGVSAYIQAKGPPQTWQISVRAPDQIISPRSKATMPALLLGRVTQSTALREPELVSAASAQNASPLGVWKISVPSKSSEGGSRDRIDDLVLELLFAAQPNR